MPFVPKFGLTVLMLNSLSAIERAIGFLEGAPLSDEWVSSMQERALIKEAHSSMLLEGARLTWNQAQRIVTGNEAPDANQAEVHALLNYKDALHYVLEFIKKEEVISEQTICDMHKMFIKDLKIVGEKPGHYRINQTYVFDPATKEIVYQPPPPFEISLLMRDFVSWLQEVKELPPILVAGIAQFHLDTIHPFGSANGRVARLLSQLILYRAGYSCRYLYSPSAYLSKEEPGYLNLIISVRQKGRDQTKWLEYFTSAFAKEMKEVIYEAKLVL